MSGLLQPLSDFFFWILRFLHENLGISWSWSIVLLTVIVRLALVPLTWRQIKSMRMLQALQPQLKALQEKYRHDRQLLNQKLMEFYQQNNISPFSSCLPLLFQLPVFLGLFYMLRDQGQAIFWDPKAWTWLTPPKIGVFASVWHSAPVGWLWISDITKFDLLLMLLYMVSQFFSSWQMARKTGGQQKAFAYIAPVVIGILMYVYKWPAGLFIYWFASNLWTIAQQFVVEKFVPAPVAPAPEPAKAKGTATRAAARPQASGRSGARPSSGQPRGGKGKSSSAGKSGGKTSGQRSGQKGKTTGGKSQRSDGGAGGSESSGGA
ncbi:MAG: membrane protein insertase YidC [Thermoleophilia bacterium]|nr:membrane protein insertase YidC [Thermoleophilia bacterium]